LSLYQEMKRRNVIRVGVAYAVAAWLLIQIAETIFPLFGYDETPARIVVVMLAIGFVPILISTWFFELTPEGLKKDKDVDHTRSDNVQAGKKLDQWIIVVLVLALSYFAFDKFVLTPQRESELQRQQIAELEQAREAGRSEALEESYGEKSIAVMPFADMSPEGDQSYFSDGISEELLNLLARIGELRVISRSSSFALRNEGLSIPELAEKLNVTYILEGSVRKAADQVRITAQLIEARSDTHLWSQTYDRTMSDVFTIQDQISAQVVDALKLELLEAEHSAGPANSAAYEIYLQGLGLLADREEIERAIELFDQVIAMDQDYAPAYASLALALVFSDQENSVRYPRLEAAVNRALALDAGNSEALAAVGRLRYEQNRVKEAREFLEQSIANNPNNAFAYRWLGTSYSDADPVRYYNLSRKAFEVDPLDPSIHYHMAIAASMIGRYESALAAARNLDPSIRDVSAGNIHHDFGHLDKALKSFYRAHRTAGWSGPLPRELIMMGAIELAEIWVADGKRSPSEVSYADLTLASLRGESELALSLWVDAAEQRGDAQGQFEKAWALTRYSDNFDKARNAFEQAFAESGLDHSQFNADFWWQFLDYALALQHSGEAERAVLLNNEIRAFLETRLTTGMVRNSHGLNFQLFLSALHAMNNEPQQAFTALRHAAAQGGLSCTHCLSRWPHWANLRGNSEFDQIIAEQKAKFASQLQRLADEGMLLTPAEVLQLDEFTFDPFAN